MAPDWTEEELSILTSVYPVVGIEAATRALPHRTAYAIFTKAHKCGLGIRKRHWTLDENERLKAQWGLESLRALAHMFGRTRVAVFQHAIAIGLKPGCPNSDWEHVADSVRRCGYTPYSMHRILKMYRVPIRPAYYVRSQKIGDKLVERARVNEAIKAYVSSETLNSAALRLKMDRRVLLRWMKVVGAPMLRTSGVARSHHRAAIADFDRAAKSYKSFVRRTETVNHACRRFHVCYTAMVRWLRVYGKFDRKSLSERIERKLVNRAVAMARKNRNKRRACANRQAPRPRRRIDAFGRSLTVTEWSRIYGLPGPTIRDRLNRKGWPAERAVSEHLHGRFGAPRTSEAA